MKHKSHKMHPHPTRDPVFHQMMVGAELGSKALARAIFATGKLHGPMTEEQQLEAIRWAYPPKKNGKTVWIG